MGRGSNPYVYLIPSLVLLVIFTYYPFCTLFILAFPLGYFTPQPVLGFENYVDVFSERVFWVVLKTLCYTQ